MAFQPKLDADTQQTMNQVIIAHLSLESSCLSYFHLFYPKQFREFLMSYNKLSEMCFTDCVHDFSGRKVSDSEVIYLIRFLFKSYEKPNLNSLFE